MAQKKLNQDDSQQILPEYLVNKRNEINYREYKNNWSMAQPHSHNFFEVYCLLDGEINFFLENKIYVLQKHSIIIAPPFYLHKTGGKPHRRVFISIAPETLSAEEDKFLRSFNGPITIDVEEGETSLFFSMLEAVSSNHKDVIFVNEYTLPFIKTLLYFLRNSKIKQLSNALVLDAQKTDALIFTIIQYINEHFSERLTLDLLSNQFFISKNSLGRRFYNVMKCSVMEYLSHIRFNDAKNLLLNSNKSITEIAQLCGFSSANYFSLIFKKTMNVSPQNFRKQNKME